MRCNLRNDHPVRDDDRRIFIAMTLGLYYFAEGVDIQFCI